MGGAGGQNADSWRVLGGYAPLHSKIVMYVYKSISHELIEFFPFLEVPPTCLHKEIPKNFFRTKRNLTKVCP